MEAPQRLRVTLPMIRSLLSYKHLVGALLAGLALRLFFIFHFPFYAGDTKFYEELARNWLYHGVYGLFVNGTLVPVDMRMPGYPAFLVAVYALAGRARTAVMVVQAAIDLLACVLAALIAARLAPASKRTAAATAALWMAALCPFTADYTAVVLTESLATFVTTLAVLIFILVLADPVMNLAPRFFDKRTLALFAGYFLVGGFVAGLGTLIRPETPLLLTAVGLVLAIRWRRVPNWPKLALAALWMGVGLLAALTPWAARNARTLGRIEFLSPRYAQSAGDFIPRGFYAWTKTWMTRFEEAYLVPWKLGKGPIRMDALPSWAFDSDAERARVAALLSRYNRDLQMTPALDYQFEILARKRAERHPLRTYLLIPAERAWAIWFTPRVELLPYSGKLWPPGEKWRSNSVDFSVTLGFGLLVFVYAGLALAGGWQCRRHHGLAMLAAWFAIRTAVLTQMQTVEPRYVIECFPALLALGALAWISLQSNLWSASRKVHGSLRVILNPSRNYATKR